MIFTSKPKGIIKRALIYTRVSTEEQAIYDSSLPYQEEMLKLQCQKDGVELVKHFKDDSYSAKDFEHRPAFTDLYEYIRLIPKQSIISMSLDGIVFLGM